MAQFCISSAQVSALLIGFSTILHGATLTGALWRDRCELIKLLHGPDLGVFLTMACGAEWEVSQWPLVLTSSGVEAIGRGWGGQRSQVRGEGREEVLCLWE
jgi:hypothetical protein